MTSGPRRALNSARGAGRTFRWSVGITLSQRLSRLAMGPLRCARPLLDDLVRRHRCCAPTAGTVRAPRLGRVAGGPHVFDSAGRCKNLDGLAGGGGQPPQRGGRFVVVLGRAHRDEQHVAVGGKRRRRLGAARQSSGPPLVRFSLSSLTVVTTREPSDDTANPDTRATRSSRRGRRTGFRSCDVRRTRPVSLIFKLTTGRLAA
jgi:hypothetical protein